MDSSNVMGIRHMELLASLPKIVSDVAIALLKQRNNNQVRERLGDLLRKVADCVSSIGTAIKAGDDPAEECAELDVYIHHLEQFVSKECSDATAKQVIFWLTHVAEAPGIGRATLTPILTREAKPKWLAWRRERQGEDVLRIAGYIRAIGNLVQT